MSILAVFAAFLSVPAIAADNDLWKRAETDHFVIYSSGKTEELVDFARELEQFDGLLRFWFRKAPRNGTDKIDIYLMDNDRQVARLHGWKLVDGFYARRVAGTFAVAHRRSAAVGQLDGRTTLFHEYAHHFMYNEFTAAVPAWLREGFAEFLSTTEFRKDGSWTLGKPALHRSDALQGSNKPAIEQVLTGPDATGMDMHSFYGWSWALTHMLYTDDDRGARIGSYIDRLAAGENALAAAEGAFGKLDALEDRLHRHVKRDIEYSVSKEAFAWSDRVDVTTLGAGESRMLELRLRRRSGGELEGARDDLVKFAAEGTMPSDAYAELAMAEIWLEERDRSENKEKYQGETGGARWFLTAEGAADKALAVDPGHVDANIAKGRILLHRLVVEERPSGHDDWKIARRYLQIANKADPENSEALYRLANSFTQERREGAMMFEAFGAAFMRAPQVHEFRLALAYDLARQGRHDEAIALLQVLANDPHSPEAGKQAVERIEWMRRTGAKFPPR